MDIFMKTEKGQQVFTDSADPIVTEKIVNHTKENADAMPENENPSTNFTNKKERMSCMSKIKLIAFIVVGVFIAVGIIACVFSCKKGCCKKNS
jgi:hypothetical protein